MLLPLLLLLPCLTVRAQHYGSLWCHQGADKDYEPAQCAPETLDCFRFSCYEMTNAKIDSFVARGCGVSVPLTATGLPNESCYQAMAQCQRLGGWGDCLTCNGTHMCNRTPVTLFLMSTVIAVVWSLL